MTELSGCWVWPGHVDRHGYARTTVASKTRLVHRAAYEAYFGPIPKPLELDHLCRNPSCYNPWHLEPVTHAENIKRGAVFHYLRQRTRCPKNHLYDDANTRIRPDGARTCRACDNERSRSVRI